MKTKPIDLIREVFSSSSMSSELIGWWVYLTTTQFKFERIEDYSYNLCCLLFNGSTCLEVVHEKVKVFEYDKISLYIPIKLLSVKEKKILYNLIYQNELQIIENGLRHVMFKPVKIDFKVIFKNRVRILSDMCKRICMEMKKCTKKNSDITLKRTIQCLTAGIERFIKKI